jgi:hypothetical protein
VPTVVSWDALRAFVAGWLGLFAIASGAAGVVTTAMAVQEQLCARPEAFGTFQVLELLPLAISAVRSPWPLLLGGAASVLAGLAVLCWPGVRSHHLA